MTNFDCYKIAIDERARHQQNYNHWMNMYAIFNGALFIAYYEILKQNPICDKYNIISVLVCALGFISGLSWHCSVRGYYRWIISWINVVNYYEANLENENIPDNVYIYRLFYEEKNSEKCKFWNFPFSTQKLTKVFTLCVTISWGNRICLYYSFFV